MLRLTAAIDGLVLSPAGGWVMSAPRNITGTRNNWGLVTHMTDINKCLYHNKVNIINFEIGLLDNL